jgi:hypothetical protein
VTLVLARAAAAGLLGAFAGVTWLALFYARSDGLRIDLDVTPPASVVQGLYPSEVDPTNRHTFAWSREAVTVTLVDLDRQADWTMEVRARAARPQDVPFPELTFFVDGTLVLARTVTNDYENIRVPIAPRPARSGVTIEMRAAPTWVPGADPRALGVMLDEITIAPSRIVLPPGRAMTGTALASAAAGTAIGLLGVSAGSAVVSAVLLTAGIAGLVQRGFGPFTDYPLAAGHAAFWVGILTAALTAFVRAIRGQPFRNTAKFAVAFTASALLLRLLTLIHPDMPIGDALFQAHRFQEVLAGRFYFTSIAPGNYQFPYAPGLYLASMPFAGLVPRGPADMTLLRIVVCAADALAGLLLYNMAVRLRGDRLAGALAVALYYLIPLGFGVVVAGNLTNAFAQSLSVAALALMANSALRLERPTIVAVLAAVLSAAFLSHTSAFAIGSVGAVFIALMFWWRGGPALRSPAIAIIVSVIAAIAVSIAVYYAHFMDTYRTELARIGSETAAAAPAAGQLTMVQRLLRVRVFVFQYFGVPLVALTIWGAVLLWRRGARDRVTLSTAGWSASCVLFVVIGIITPVDLRHYLAAIPVFALLAAAGSSIAWTSGGVSRIAAGVLLGWAVLIGVRAWWGVLG